MYVSNQIGGITPNDEVKVELIEDRKIKISIRKVNACYDVNNKWTYLSSDILLYLDLAIAEGIANDIKNAMYSVLEGNS
jgi:hypothetical protein